MIVRVLVLPIYRRYCLQYAWTKLSAAENAVPKSLLSRLQALAMQQVQKQWHKVETAPEGTLNNKLFRLAQAVQSRVDPSETFLKALPQAADVLEVRFPSSLPERLVRRRLRLLAAKAEPFHRSRLMLWAAAIIPQVPLIPLPLPNVTLYYTAWRVASNFSAERGAAALSAALELSSDLQRLKLAQQLQRQQREQGLQLLQGSWTQQLVQNVDTLERRVQDALADDAQQQPGVGSRSSSVRRKKRLPLPVFVADAELDRLTQPAQRASSPLPLTALQQLMQLYKQPHLLEHFKAANRKCLSPQQQQEAAAQ